MQRKAYNPPTLTDHGPVVELTKGLIGFMYELHGMQDDGGDPIRPPKPGS